MVLQIFNQFSSANLIVSSFSHLSLMYIVDGLISICNAKSWKSVFLSYLFDQVLVVVALARLLYYSPLEGKDELIFKWVLRAEENKEGAYI